MINITYDMIESVIINRLDGLSVIVHGGEFYGPNTRGKEWDITNTELSVYAIKQVESAKRIQSQIRSHIASLRGN